MGERIGFNTSFVQILFIRLIAPLICSPNCTAGYAKPHTGCIIDRIGNRLIVLLPRRENLNRHDLHTVVVSAAARDTADTNTIVVHRSDRPRHVCSRDHYP